MQSDVPKLDRVPRSTGAASPARRPWSAPAVEDLAPLRELTLQSAIPGGEWGFSWLNPSEPAGPLA